MKTKVQKKLQLVSLVSLVANKFHTVFNQRIWPKAVGRHLEHTLKFKYEIQKLYNYNVNIYKLYCGSHFGLESLDPSRSFPAFGGSDLCFQLKCSFYIVAIYLIDVDMWATVCVF